MSHNPLIIFCHLRWDFVFQRPQHLLSRLAANRKIYFIEEPDFVEGAPHMEKRDVGGNITICRPKTSVREPHFHANQMPVLAELVRNLVKEEGLKDYSVWIYTPMALPAAKALEPVALVWDCMDELSAFKGAPPELLELEKQTLQHADVVFTGGPSMYRAKQHRHPNIHCFSSSVDAKHFGQARRDYDIEEPPEQQELPHPRLGFYGVIDERMDIELLDKMAKAHPEWQIVMVGPVVKIDPNALPKHRNIHYFGQRGYNDLPKFLAGWDVCMMPFAMNESTKFISPTKVLEYMAAERMIVSTPITDVVEPYGDICYIGNTHEEFIKMCEAALAAEDIEQVRRITRMRQVLSRTSWDATAEAMEQLISQAEENAVVRRQAESGTSHNNVAEIAQSPNQSGTITTGTLIAGAGPTGLSACYHLGDDALLVDQNNRVGGWCRSINDRGFTFDYAGHIMFSNDPYVHEMYKTLLGDNLHWQNREAWIYSKKVYTRYPFQGALYGLPPKVISECILGAIEARFGSLTTKADEHARKLAGGNGSLTGTAHMNGHSNGHNNNGHHNGVAKACTLVNGVKDCCADGIMESEVELGHREKAAALRESTHEPKNFEEFIYKVWGWGIAKHFAIPYNRKIWAVDLKEMETSWLGGRVPLPNLEEMIQGALEPVPPPMGPNAKFGYPLKGGFQALMDGFLPYVKNRLMLSTRIVAVDPRAHTATLSTGKTVRYHSLVSTMPLPVLIRIMGDQVPAEIRQAAEQLRHTSVKCVNIGVNRENITDKHWIYYPEDTVFHRIFVQGNASPHCNAPGGFGFTCEITYSPTKPLPCDGQELIDLCVKDCRRVGFIREDDRVITANVVDMPYAYVIYDHQRKAIVEKIRVWLEQHDILLSGRYSEWEYYNSDHAFIAGRKVAEAVKARQPVRIPADIAARVRGRMSERAKDGWTSATTSTSRSAINVKT